VLGGKYIAIVQGAEEDTLKDGGRIEDTQGALILEDLIGQFIKNLGN
jgi:phospholipid/cholesterol/gamma-HCH transport system substrate-binding protein